MHLRYGLSCVLIGAAAQLAWAGPYAPAATQPGSTAVDKNSPDIVAWATGYQNYLVGTNVDADWQTPAKALGPAVGDAFDIVCLGNGGQITLTFDQPITDGTGGDFAVFENGISDGFLELAYVEVSSDGVNFFRFPSHSLTASAVSTYATLDPTNIDGLASKYRQGFGTPFDLSQLAGTAGLDINAVTQVRIVDIIGDGSALDSDDNPIYDPTPTWGSGGFDLDAVAVMHQVPEPASLCLFALTVPWIVARRKHL